MKSWKVVFSDGASATYLGFTKKAVRHQAKKRAVHNGIEIVSIKVVEVG